MISLTCLLQDLCRKCINHNASCGKAWERLGSILEREQAYKVVPWLHIVTGRLLHLNTCEAFAVALEYMVLSICA